MPYHTSWVEPELFLEHQGIPVFHTYRHDVIEEGSQRYLYTVQPECGAEESHCEAEPCRHMFDVRALASWQPPLHPPYCTGTQNTHENYAAWEQFWQQEQEAIRAAILAAIEKGELTSDGLLRSSRSQPV